jgi:hypothetical protein
MRFRCRICEQDLLETTAKAACTYCGAEKVAEWLCPEGHHICETCRTSSAEDLIARACCFLQETNPLKAAELILRHTAFPAYGDAHHVLVAPVVLASLRNRGIDGVNEAVIREAMTRLRGIPACVCGTRGDCGAAASAGTVVSLLRKATPLSDAERSAALHATAEALCRIADHGGPRCCKQSMFDAIYSAWEHVKGLAGVDDLPVHACAFAGRLKDCKTTRCPYFA